MAVCTRFSRCYQHLLCLLVLAAPLYLPGPAWSEDLVLETPTVTVYFQSQEQQRAFAEAIQPDSFSQTLDNLFGGQSTSPSELGQYLQKLMQRVQRALDMPVPKIQVFIKVFNSQKELAQASQELTGWALSEPGFYWHATKTIHVELKGLTVGVLAHEMGHAVLDNYLIVRPPTKIAEMLCQYVDKEISAGRF